MVPGLKRKIRKARRKEAVRAMLHDGLTKKEVAEALNLSQRTIQRIVKERIK
jgi:DNA-binding NarL/FixJ family response regulator